MIGSLMFALYPQGFTGVISPGAMIDGFEVLTPVVVDMGLVTSMPISVIMSKVYESMVAGEEPTAVYSVHCSGSL